MNRSVVPTVRQAIVDRLRLRAGLSGIQVEPTHPGAAIEEETIFLGDAHDGKHEIANLKAGRKSRNEEFTLDVYVAVLTPGNSATEAEQRAFALLGEVESMLADDPRVGLAASVLQSAEGGDWEESLEPEELGWTCALRFEVKCRARLT